MSIKLSVHFLHLHQEAVACIALLFPRREYLDNIKPWLKSQVHILFVLKRKREFLSHSWALLINVHRFIAVSFSVSTASDFGL